MIRSQHRNIYQLTALHWFLRCDWCFKELSSLLSCLVLLSSNFSSKWNRNTSPKAAKCSCSVKCVFWVVCSCCTYSCRGHVLKMCSILCTLLACMCENSSACADSDLYLLIPVYINQGLCALTGIFMHMTSKNITLRLWRCIWSAETRLHCDKFSRWTQSLNSINIMSSLE